MWQIAQWARMPEHGTLHYQGRCPVCRTNVRAEHDLPRVPCPKCGAEFQSFLTLTVRAEDVDAELEDIISISGRYQVAVLTTENELEVLFSALNVDWMNWNLAKACWEFDVAVPYLLDISSEIPPDDAEALSVLSGQLRAYEEALAELQSRAMRLAVSYETLRVIRHFREEK